MKTSEEPKFFKVPENVHSQKTVGVLGGFGPETTAEFYISVINKNRKVNDRHPNILINNSPVPFDLEEDAVKNCGDPREFMPLLAEGISAVEDKADFIVLPCNMLHIFIGEIRKISRKPVISIIEETVKAVKSGSFKKVGIIGSLRTLREGLFDSELKNEGIEIIKPDEPRQKRISEIIYLILNGDKSDSIKKEVVEIIYGLREKGAEAVIMGCTDFQLLVKQADSPVKLIDTMEVLVDSTVK